MVDLVAAWHSSAAVVGRVLTLVPADDGGGLGPSGQDPATVHQAACKVLDAPCTTAAPTATSTSGSGGANIGGPLTLFFYVIVLAALAGVVYLIVRAVRGRRRTEDADTTKIEEQEPTTIIDRTTEPDQWRKLAVEALAAGRYREALRCRYRALVGDLARRGLLDEIPGRTTGEERAQFAAKGSPAQREFNDATDLFDGVWYGDEPAGIDEHDRFVEREREVLAATAGRARR